jgi:hypothetical protein
MNGKIALNKTIVGSVVVLLCSILFLVPQAWSQQIVIDEVLHALLLNEAQILSLQADVVESPGTAEEMRGVVKWQSGGKVQIIYTDDGNGDPLPNSVIVVTNETSFLNIGLDGQRNYRVNAFDYLTGDLITMLRGIAVDPQQLWVFSNEKTIINETGDQQYAIRTLGSAIQIRLEVDLPRRVVTRIETYAYGALTSTVEASSFSLVGGVVYLPATVIVDPDVTDGVGPVTYNYSNYSINPSFSDRIFEMPQ